MLKSIGIFLFGLLIFIFSFLYSYGVFSSIKIVKENKGPYYIVYQKYVGDYSKIGPVFDNL